MENDKIIDDFATVEPTGEYNLANQGTRLGNLLIDGIILAVAYNLLIMLVFSMQWSVEHPFVNIFLTIVFYVFYYTLLESNGGKTIGKYLTRTKVVMRDGSQPSMSTCLIRSICRYVPFEPFSFLASKRGWHDSWSKTYVIKE